MLATDLDMTVRTVVSRHLDLAPHELTRDIDLRAAGLDGDVAIDVMEDVEEALDVRFPDDFLDGLVTYGDLTAAVRVAIGN
jgi:acyl carrier protein